MLQHQSAAYRAGNGWIIVGDGDSETFEEYADAETIPQEMTSTRDNLRQDYLWPLPNLWLGVTVCNRDELWKLDVLRKIPAALRFVSFEPLLSDLGNVDLSGIGWVIAGGETGSGARPMNPDWVRSLRDQCQEATVPFFFKSWGEWAPDCLCGTKKPHPETPRPTPGHMGCMFKCGKANSGRSIDKRTWDEVPQ